MTLRNRNRYSLSNVCGKFVVCLILWTNIIYSVSAKCSCYAYFGELKTWQSGRTLCQSGNGDLVSIETLDEWEFIKDQIQKKFTAPRGYNEWWIGLKYDKTRKQWKWLSNRTLTYTDKWQKGKPSDVENKQKYYTMIARQYPNQPKYQGSFNNEKSEIGRGYICEYEFKEGNQACKINKQWCSSSITTTSRTTKQDTSTTTTSHTTAALLPQTVTTTTAPVDADPSSQPHKANPMFQWYIIVIILVILLVILAVLIVFVYRLKRKRDLKPRNSHLCKDSRVPVKLEHNSSTSNLNDKIIYADVVNLDGNKIQINCDSQGLKNTKRPGEVKPYNTETVIYANLSNENKNLDQETTDHSNRMSWNKSSDKVKLLDEMEEVHEKDETTTCLYDQVNQSKAAVDNDSEKANLFYAQIGDFKDLNPTSPPPKKPEPYTETDYAVIVKP